MGLLSRATINFASPNLDAVGSETGLNKTLPPESEIKQFYDVYNVLNGIIFDSKGDNNFHVKIQNIIDRAGTVIPLPSGNPLILLRGTVDRELITHRLSRSLDIMPVLSFEAETPENLIKQIRKV